MTRWALLCALPMLATAAAPYAGSAVCGQCHREQAAHFRETPMALALEPVASCDILQQHPAMTFREAPYDSRIRREGNRSLLTVTGGAETLEVPLLWAFGRGQAGQTYVFERNGFYFESRASYYNALGGLDLTMGAQGSKPKNLEEAAGRRLDAASARDCFGCHSAGGVSEGRLHLESLVPGVGCESCHGPAAAHVEAIRAGNPAAAKLPKLHDLPAEDMSNLCGRCHRTWEQIAMNGPRGVYNVRFQPYRLANSKCYDAADARIRCAACHDPHGPLAAAPASYDAKCAACHAPAPKPAAAARAAARPKLCPVAKKDCVTCHMPKFELPGAHARFSDHQIRVVRANEAYPN